MSNKIISPDSYRKKVYKEEVVEVPSGVLFKIKKISPMEFIRKGLKDIPNPFLEFVQEGTKKALDKMVKDEDASEFLQKFVEIIITDGIIEPKVVLKYEEDETDNVLFWSEINQEDQAFLLNKIAGVELRKVG